MNDVATNDRPSKITIPPKGHPYARLVFAEMARQGITYEELEWRSNVLISTFKAWRKDNRPGLETIEAALGALGWELVPVPRYDRLPKNVQQGLEALRDLWKREEPILHQFLAVCCEARTLPTKTPGGSRFQQAANLVARMAKRSLRIALKHPIESRGGTIETATLRISDSVAPRRGDFKGSNLAPCLADFVAMSPAQIAALSQEDSENLMRVAAAAQAITAAAKVLSDSVDFSVDAAMPPKLKVAA